MPNLQRGNKIMSVKNFKFVSPGVFINEIDNSFTPRNADTIGPVVIGRSEKGLAMTPVNVQSYSEYVEAFGETVPGFAGGDVARDGNFQSPMYGTYAAKAFLRPNVAPLTYIRLLGQQSADNDGTSAAQSGWRTETGGNQTTPVDGTTTAGGAYGLFVALSQSAGTYTGTANGFRLAAVLYVPTGSVKLSGSLAGSDTETADEVVDLSSAIINSDSNGNFKITIDGEGSVVEEKNYFINFDDNSANFVRKVLNTNPQRTTTPGTFYPTGSFENYWLGETYEQSLRDNSLIGVPTVGVVAAIASGSAKDIGPHNLKGIPSQEGIAGWFIGQDLGTAANFVTKEAPKLFRLIGRGHGAWLSRNLKVSIEQVKQSNNNSTEYGTFSVVLRSINDTDNHVMSVERFDNCTLDPSSPDFIARKIGDKYSKWNESERRLISYGDYDNQSKFVRVEVNPDIEAGALDPTLLPFGYFGPPKFRDLLSLGYYDTFNNTDLLDKTYVEAGATLPGASTTLGTAGADSLIKIMSASVLITAANATASFFFPEDRLRAKATDGGLSDQTRAYFGIDTTRATTSARNDRSIADLHKLLYGGLGQTDNVPVDVSTDTYNDGLQGLEGFSYIFTLDDVSASADTVPVYNYSSGSRAAETSTTARGTNTYETLLNANINRFTAPFWGGFDGFDITKPDPLRNGEMSSTSTNATNYVYYTYRRALDTIADPDQINLNLLAVPGLTQETLTEHMIDICEDRGDAMAIIDLPDVYIPAHEAYKSDKSERVPANPTSTANTFKQRRIDSSYGATYYPWVQTRDTGTGQLVWIPPTVAMMGVLASSERQSEIWFAPAGFNRGGLTQGAAGIPVTNVSEKLISRDRDTLYEARINPIASFPSSGIVVFGQKTLQERASALDRINVRRLVIFLKKQISILSTQVLFEQNVEATWRRFKNLVEPLLSDVKTRFGITEYKLVLDSSTTTPDLIDQNILYAKIMVKPARAIEYIAIDFVIANSGASFDD
jgi:hypothetical protein